MHTCIFIYILFICVFSVYQQSIPCHNLAPLIIACAVGRFLPVKWHTLNAKRFVRHSFATASARVVWLLKAGCPLREIRATALPVDIVQRLLFHLLLPIINQYIYINTSLPVAGAVPREQFLCCRMLVAHKINTLSASNFYCKLFYCVLSFIVIYLLDFVVFYFYFCFLSR